MAKQDFKKVHKRLYGATTAPALVEVPELAYLMIDGAGDPDKVEYQRAVAALYGVAYGAKFALKNGPDALDYAVMPLEGRWWADGGDLRADTERSAWCWSMMILQPPQVTAELLDSVVATVRKRKPDVPVDGVRLERLREGASGQILHVGPYREETPTIDRLLAFIGEAGHEVTGLHHEIYLSDPKRVAPEKLKTIIRYPVRPVA